jgi:hypothetical protein
MTDCVGVFLLPDFTDLQPGILGVVVGLMRYTGYLCHVLCYTCEAGMLTLRLAG